LYMHCIDESGFISIGSLALLLYMSPVYECSLRSKNATRAGGYYSYPLLFGGVSILCW